MRTQIIVNCFAKLLNSLLIELFMLRNWRFTAHALLFALATSAACPCFAQDMNLVGRMCPADLSTYALQDGTSCDPKGENSKACDRKFNAPSRPWHDCLQEIQVCQDRINEYNKKASAYNNWVNQCRDADKKRIDDLQRTAKTTSNSNATNPSASPLSAELAKAREAARREAQDSALNNSNARLELDTLVQKKAAEERARQAAADRLRAQRGTPDLSSMIDEQKRKAAGANNANEINRQEIENLNERRRRIYEAEQEELRRQRAIQQQMNEEAAGAFLNGVMEGLSAVGSAAGTSAPNGPTRVYNCGMVKRPGCS